MKKKIIFSFIIASIVGLPTSSLYVKHQEDAYTLALKNIEVLAEIENSDKDLDKCYTYYVFSLTTEVNGCEGQLDDTPKECSLVAWAKGIEGYEKKCIKK